MELPAHKLIFWETKKGATVILIESQILVQYPLLTHNLYVLVTGVVAMGSKIEVELNPVAGDHVYVNGNAAPKLTFGENLHA